MPNFKCFDHKVVLSQLTNQSYVARIYLKLDLTLLKTDNPPQVLVYEQVLLRELCVEKYNPHVNHQRILNG